MSECWVMTERKIITVDEPITGAPYDHPNTRLVARIFDAGDPAPAGHEGRPYTRKLEDATAARIEEQAPNRMLNMSGAKKRGRPRKVWP